MDESTEVLVNKFVCVVEFSVFWFSVNSAAPFFFFIAIFICFLISYFSPTKYKLLINNPTVRMTEWRCVVRTWTINFFYLFILTD